MHADSEATFLADYKTIGKKLGVDQRLDGTDLLDAIRNKIEGQSKWVMILDNADELKMFGVGQQQEGTENQDLRKYVPSQGTVLWTSRDAHIGGTLVGASRSIQVQSMATDEATKLLATTRGDPDLSIHDGMGVDRLLKELQCLPLAVSQAGTYMRRMSMTAEEYLSLLNQGKSRWEVLKVSDTDRHRRPEVSNSVLETWRISTERIKAESEMSYRILHVIAYVDSQDIPHELVVAAAHPFSNGRKDDKVDKASATEVSGLEVLAAVARLMEFSYLRLRQTDDGERSYDMHKLVREALQYGLRIGSPQAEALYSGRALQVVNGLLPMFEQSPWARCYQYLPHAIQVGEWAELSETEAETANFLDRVSHFLYHRGRWREKESVDSRAWSLRREVLGEKHPHTIRSLANLWGAYLVQGQYSRAHDIAKRVLELRQEVLGTHPDTIRSIADLGNTYLSQGRYDEAKGLQENALRLQRDMFGEKDPETIRTMADLGETYYQQGQWDEARKLKENVLNLRQEIAGEKHPDTIRSWEDLGAIYQAQGQYAEAQDIAIKVLKLRQEVLGTKHPDTIRSMANLGATYHTQGRYDDAQDIATEVLEFQKEFFGEKHPETIRTMADLGTTYYEKGQFDEAEKICSEALELRRETLGDRHPDTIKSLANIAAISHQQGQYSKALKLHQTNLSLRRQMLGENHPDTMHTLADMATTYHQQGEYSKALELHQTALKLRREVLGEHHPDTVRSVAHVASTRAWLQRSMIKQGQGEGKLREIVRRLIPQKQGR